MDVIYYNEQKKKYEISSLPQCKNDRKGSDTPLYTLCKYFLLLLNNYYLQQYF